MTVGPVARSTGPRMGAWRSPDDRGPRRRRPRDGRREGPPGGRAPCRVRRRPGRRRRPRRCARARRGCLRDQGGSGRRAARRADEAGRRECRWQRERLPGRSASLSSTTSGSATTSAGRSSTAESPSEARAAGGAGNGGPCRDAPGAHSASRRDAPRLGVFRNRGSRKEQPQGWAFDLITLRAGIGLAGGLLIAATVTPAALAADCRLAAAAGSSTRDEAVQVNTFLPKNLTIDAGDSNIWTVRSGEFHTVTFPSGTVPPPFIIPIQGVPQINPAAAAPSGGRPMTGVRSRIRASCSVASSSRSASPKPERTRSCA